MPNCFSLFYIISSRKRMFFSTPSHPAQEYNVFLLSRTKKKPAHHSHISQDIYSSLEPVFFSLSLFYFIICKTVCVWSSLKYIFCVCPSPSFFLSYNKAPSAFDFYIINIYCMPCSLKQDKNHTKNQ